MTAMTGEEFGTLTQLGGSTDSDILTEFSSFIPITEPAVYMDVVRLAGSEEIGSELGEDPEGVSEAPAVFGFGAGSSFFLAGTGASGVLEVVAAITEPIANAITNIIPPIIWFLDIYMYQIKLFSNFLSLIII
jgi:hypothetical protein